MFVSPGCSLNAGEHDGARTQASKCRGLPWVGPLLLVAMGWPCDHKAIPWAGRVGRPARYGRAGAHSGHASSCVVEDRAAACLPGQLEGRATSNIHPLGAPAKCLSTHSPSTACSAGKRRKGVFLDVGIRLPHPPGLCRLLHLLPSSWRRGDVAPSKPSPLPLLPMFDEPQVAQISPAPDDLGDLGSRLYSL